MNKHIGLVKKWLANPESITKEELKANAYAAADAADAAYAAYWVKRYEELTNER